MSKYLIEFNGKLASMAEHCRDLNVSYGAINHLMHRHGISFEEAIIRHFDYINRRKVVDRRLYNIWYQMMDRCYNPKNSSYYRYGGRKPKPIKVCEIWHNYFNFEDDMYASYKNHCEKFGIGETTIDRYPNKLGDYEPTNVRWATRKEQSNNRTTNVEVLDGINISQFVDKYNLSNSAVRYRIAHGWSVDNIVNIPTGAKYFLPCGINLYNYCNLFGYSYNAIHHYIKRYDMTADEALAKYLSKSY